jgi:ceramide glucosyltransferase
MPSLFFPSLALSLFTAVLALLVSGAIAFYLACAYFTWRFFATPEPTTAGFAPPISLLVPACGVDEGARENWLSLCQQEYPEFEVLFGVVDPQDPAILLIQELVTQFPGRVRLFTDLKPKGVNYKDSSLSYLLEQSQHDLIVFADSDICVRPDYLRTVTAPLADPTVGMVTCAYAAYHPKFLGAALASLGRVCDFIPSILIAQGIDGALRFAIGVTMAVTKTSLEKAGGLQFNRIGSDYNLGKRVAEAGYRIHLSHYILDSDTGRESAGDVFQRELRWSRTIRFNRGAQYYTMIFCYGTVYCWPLILLGALAGGQSWALGLGLTALAVRYLQAIVAITQIGTYGLLPWLWVLPFRDFLSLVIWGLGAFGRGVYWRGRKLRVEGDGVITLGE